MLNHELLNYELLNYELLPPNCGLLPPPGASLRDRRKARHSLGEHPTSDTATASARAHLPELGPSDGAGQGGGATRSLAGEATPARLAAGGGHVQLSGDLSYDIAMTPPAAAAGGGRGWGSTKGREDGGDGGESSGLAADSGLGESVASGGGADDDEAALPLAYDGHGSEGLAAPEAKRTWGFAGKALVSAARPCPSSVLTRYEVSGHETLVGLHHQRWGAGSGVTSLVPHGGLLEPPPPLEKQFVPPVTEEVVWEGSTVTDKPDFAKGVHVEWQDRSDDADEALAAVSAFWGKGLTRRSDHQRLPRSTRKELHSLEAPGADTPALHDAPVSDKKGGRRGKKGKKSRGASGEPASREASPERSALRHAPKFAPKGEDMALHIESLQVQGLGTKVGASVRVEVYVGKNAGAEASKAVTSKKKLAASHAVEWGGMTALPVAGDMLDEGVLHVRVLEPRLLGEPACVGTAALALCEAARHQDVEEDPLHHGKWVDLMGAGRGWAVDEQAPEPVAAASIRVVLVVRAADSAHARLQRAIDAVNRRHFGEGLREAEAAKARFLALHNTRMAAQALDVIQEAEQRRAVVVPRVMRRLKLLSERLTLPDLRGTLAPDARPGSLQAGWAASALAGSGELAEGQGAAEMSLPAHACLVSFEEAGAALADDGRRGEVDGDEGDGRTGTGMGSHERGGLERLLAESADLIMDKKSFKRRMRGMASHLSLDDAGKARAILPVGCMPLLLRYSNTAGGVHAIAITLLFLLGCVGEHVSRWQSYSRVTALRVLQGYL